MEDYHHAVSVYRAVVDACEGGHPEMVGSEYRKVQFAYYNLSPEERQKVELPSRAVTLGQSAYELAFTCNQKLHDQMKK